MRGMTTFLVSFWEVLVFRSEVKTLQFTPFILILIVLTNHELHY